MRNRATEHGKKHGSTVNVVLAVITIGMILRLIWMMS